MQDRDVDVLRWLLPPFITLLPFIQGKQKELRNCSLLVALASLTEMADITKEELRKEITAILKDADLATMSAKKVRQQIEEKLDVDLMSRKKEVDSLVMECLQEKQDVKKESGTKKKSKDDDEEDEEEEEEEEEDEEEEEEEEEKAKPKRGGANKKKRPKKGSSDESDEGSDEDASDDDYSPSKKAKGSAKKGKPAAKKKKGSDSDSDEDWAKSRKTNAGGGGAKKGGGGGGKRRGSGRPYTLSPELAAVVGQDTMARPEVVRKVWAVIKERNLFDPKNKQFAICDDELMKVFGVKRFRTFGMMKYLKNHFVD